MNQFIINESRKREDPSVTIATHFHFFYQFIMNLIFSYRDESHLVLITVKNFTGLILKISSTLGEWKECLEVEFTPSHDWLGNETFEW